MLLSLSNTLFSFLVPAPSPASRPGLVRFLPPVLLASCGEPSEESPACSELSLSSVTLVVWVCFHATIRVHCYSLCLCSRHIVPSSPVSSGFPPVSNSSPRGTPSRRYFRYFEFRPSLHCFRKMMLEFTFYLARSQHSSLARSLCLVYLWPHVLAKNNSWKSIVSANPRFDLVPSESMDLAYLARALLAVSDLLISNHLLVCLDLTREE